MAGAPMNVDQEGWRRLLSLRPVVHDCYAASIGEDKPAHIERVAKGVLRELRAHLAVHATAGIRTHRADLCHWRAEARLCGRLHHVSEPLIEFGDHRAVEGHG